MYDCTFWAGKHNGGLYNMFNHGSYIYCYQNPVNLIDPNGKQTESITIDGGTIEEVKIVAGKKSGFSWSAFGRGLVKGLVVAVVVVAVVAAVVVTGGAALDLVGIVVDGVAICVPIVPGSAGTLIKSYRVANTTQKVYRLYTGSKLARNMYKAFQANRATSFLVAQGIMEAHHIIPKTAKIANEARKKMAKFKIDIDDAMNGVALPKEFHRSVAHKKEYYKRFEKAVEKWKSADDIKYFFKTEADYLIKEASEMAKKAKKRINYVRFKILLFKVFTIGG